MLIMIFEYEEWMYLSRILKIDFEVVIKIWVIFVKIWIRVFEWWGIF